MLDKKGQCLRDTMVVTKLDRIARSTKHLLEIVDFLKKKKDKLFREFPVNNYIDT